MVEFLTPGAFVRHPDRPDWGLGQVQSVTGQRVTVNFEGAGKVLILIDRVSLIAAEPDPARGF
jgi:transcription elongation factor GreA-like protein